jgi:hypothetical protein
MNTLRKQLGLDRARAQAKSPPAEKTSGNGDKRPSKPEVDPDATLSYQCGHKVGARHLQGKPCPACVRQRRRARSIARGQRRRPDSIPRLPDGATFCATYCAQSLRWVGTLAIGEHVFEAESPGVFPLLAELDRLYRAQGDGGASAANQDG